MTPKAITNNTLFYGDNLSLLFLVIRQWEHIMEFVISHQLVYGLDDTFVFRRMLLPAIIALIATLYLSAQPVHAATIIVTNAHDAGPGSLRQAVIDASSGDTITFDPWFYSEQITIRLTSGYVLIDKSLTIDGAYGSIVMPTIDDGANSSIFMILVGSVGLNQLKLINGHSFAGSGIVNYGTLTVTNSTLSGNNASLGGGIANYFGTVNVTNSTFLGNSAVTSGGDGGGGGIYNYFGTLNVTNSTFSGNSAANSGGGIYNDTGGMLAVTNSTFSGNIAARGAGDIYNAGMLTVTNSSFSGDIVGTNGWDRGGINNYGTLNVTNSTFLSNSTYFYGGGINNYGTLTVTNSTFSGNSAANLGGGINNTGMLNVTNSTFSGNYASLGGAINNYGGGIHNSGTLTVTNSTFSGNNATDSGGGIYNNYYGTLNVTNSTFSGNSAANSGGGIYNSGMLNMTNNIIAESPQGGDCVNIGSTISSNNLIKDAVHSCGRTNGTKGNIIGLDPLLGSLANNGGSTLTFALLPSSPAINTGNNITCPDADQRGVKRPQGGICDIGAVESLIWPRAYLPTVQK
jgi:predicted outer membrane repeat protein